MDSSATIVTGSKIAHGADDNHERRRLLYIRFEKQVGGDINRWLPQGKGNGYSRQTLIRASWKNLLPEQFLQAMGKENRTPHVILLPRHIHKQLAPRESVG